MADILIIDDEVAVRAFLRSILVSVGHQVREAGDGVDGIERVRERCPDLILCDLFMPVKEGLETIREIRRIAPAVRIVAISGGSWGRTDLLSVAKELGADEVAYKPISAPRLLGLLGGSDRA